MIRKDALQVFGPKYLTRKMLVLSVLGEYKITRFLEVGFGRGDFMFTLARMGCVGKGIDLSYKTVKDVQDTIDQKGLQGRLGVQQRDLFEMERDEENDAVFAFEVLEHIEEDEQAVRRLASLLRTGGILVLSVPAHERFRGLTDELAGHLRRYERRQIIHLLDENGFKVRKILSYGFPILLLIKRVRDVLDKYCSNSLLKRTIRHRTTVSGTYRPYETRFPTLVSVINRFLLPIIDLTQGPFLGSDIGEG